MAALPAVAGEPLGSPVPGDPPRIGAPAPGVPLVADRHVPSTDLGFERGIGPAAGQTVTWRGVDYLVVDVAADGGRPTFSGGSRFAITTAGGTLEIGLKALEATDRRLADARR
ncbi:MAG TPA: hypothetical protein VEC60_10905 [Reyranella sp.]|nr:hypothetical protein [Reyranella sp.]